MLQWSTCHQKLSGYRAVTMSWTHQSLDHVMNKSSVIGSSLSYLSLAELWTCIEHIGYWFTIVILVIYRTLNMWWTHQSLGHHRHVSHLQNFDTIVVLVICRTLNMSWTHQLLVHHCHISHLQNFELVMNTSVIGSPLSCQSFTESWTCHASRLQNLFFFENINISSNIVISSSHQSWTKYHFKVWTQ